jgi:hypothetical protein
VGIEGQQMLEQGIKEKEREREGIVLVKEIFKDTQVTVDEMSNYVPVLIVFIK